ncbi:MAG: penicillin-binding protein 2 [Capsulimonadaceae bacterium]
MADRRSVAHRAAGFGAVIAVLFAVLIGRLWFLQIVHGDEYRAQADSNEVRSIRTRAPRGTIVDIRGRLLAGNRARFAVYATPDITKNGDEVARLAALLEADPDDIRDSIESAQQDPYDPIRLALDVPMEVVTRIEEERVFLPGVSTAPEPVRWYPQGKVAAQLLGTVGRISSGEYLDRKGLGYFSDDFLGKSGVESSYEPYLRGKPGSTRVQIDARGRLVRRLGTVDAAAGDTVVLSIDSRLQAAGEKVFAQNRFIGAAVAMDPQSGAVLAMVSAPSYNPGALAGGIKPAVWKPLNTSPEHPLINRAVDAMYPPGSTFKPIVAAAGLETGSITTHSSAYCPGAYYLGKSRFGCWERHGEVDFYEAMAKSCDVFFYIAGQKIGPDRMATYATSFGLAQRTGIDLPHEDIGTIPSPDWKERHYARYGGEYGQWFGGDTLHMAIGQGDVLVTPLQMARVAATIANGGDVLKPYVVDRVIDPAGQMVLQNARTVLNHVPVSPDNIDAVRTAMRQTVTDGTGKIVDLSGLAVAAKTGSAQVHGDPRTHGWFICFAPYDHPTIAIAAVVEHGGHGGDTAGLVARAMLQYYFHLKGGRVTSARSD